MSNFLRQFGRKEDGQVAVEFVLAVPLVFTLFMTSVEMGIYAVRQMFLERGMDLAAREIRLATGSEPQHDDIKNNICGFAGFLPDCNSTLRLEMVRMDPRAFDQSIYGEPDCLDAPEPVTDPGDLRNFIPGNSHELVILRACYAFEPVFPTSGLGFAWAQDNSGRAHMFASSAFVQEPQ
ncbi:MAG: TadE family protein [Paracoccaceae bacterium]